MTELLHFVSEEEAHGYQRIREKTALIARAVCDQMDLCHAMLTGEDHESHRTIMELEQTIQFHHQWLEKFTAKHLTSTPHVEDNLERILQDLKVCTWFCEISDHLTSISRRMLALETEDAASLTAPVLPLLLLIQQGLALLPDGVMNTRLPDLSAWVDQTDAREARYTVVYQAFVDHTAAHPDDAPDCAHMLFVAKNLERIGLHTTRIAASLLPLTEKQAAIATLKRHIRFDDER